MAEATENPKPCSKCGSPHTKCTAHTRAGKPCGQRPMAGQRVCRMHGGTAPQALAAAQARTQERKAILAVESFGLPREIDPHSALLEELHRTAGAVEWLGAIVADLRRNQVAWGQTRHKTGGEDHGTTLEAKPNAFVLLWQGERKNLVAVAKTCIEVGIEERRVRLAEDAGRQLAGLVRAVLDRLNLTDDQRALSLVVVPEEFRRLGETA